MFLTYFPKNWPFFNRYFILIRQEFDLEFFASAHKKDQLDAKKKKMRAQFRSLLEGARGVSRSILLPLPQKGIMKIPDTSSKT